MRSILRMLFVCFAISLSFLATDTAAQTNSFMYQGRLTDSSGPATGTYSMKFDLFSVPAGGTAIATQTSSISVTNGIFTAVLDLGANFDGNARYIEISISGTLLNPRQQVLSTPYALRAAGAGLADNLSSACVLCITDARISSVDASKITGVLPVNRGGTGSSTQNFVDLTTNQTVGGNKTFTGTISGNGSGLTNLNGGNISIGSITADRLAPSVAQTNSSLLGSLRWDVLKPQASFNTGGGSLPIPIAFDGTNVWIGNSGGSSVSKFRVSDGAFQQTFGIFGSNPLGIAFDGTNVWVTSTTSVTRLRASDGACVGTCNFTAGSSPWGIAFDGSSIWVANSSSATVTKFRASDGSVLGTFPVGASPQGVVFDGTNIWVANNTGNTVTKLKASDGSNQGTFPVAGNPDQIATDGTNVWVVNGGGVTKLRISDGASLGTFPTGGTSPTGIAFDGTNIWVSNSASNTVSKIKASDGSVLAVYPTGNTPRYLAFDGNNMWVPNQLSNSLIRLPPVFP